MMKNIITSCLWLGLVSWSPSLSADPVPIPPPVTISTEGANATDPQILIIPGGGAVAVWIENGILTSRHAFFSQTWSSPPDVLSGSVASDPALAQDSIGNIIAVWVENGVIKSSKRSTDGAWSSSTTLSSIGASEPTVAVDPNGNTVAVWTRNAVIESASMPSGGGWSSASVLSGSNAGDPSVSIDPNGNAIAAWTQVVSGVSNIYSASQPFGLAWSSATLVSASTVNSTNVQISSYPNGNAVAIWYRYAVNNDFYSNVIVQYAIWSLADGWTIPVDLSSPGKMNPANLIAQVRVDSLGNAYAFWTTSFDGSQIVLETANAPYGSAFSATIDFISPNPLVFGYDSACDPSGSLSLGWMSLDSVSSSLFIYGSYRTTLGNWVNPILISDGGQSAYPLTSIFRDSNYLYFGGVWVNYDGDSTVVQSEYIILPRTAPPTDATVVQQTNNYTVASEVCNIVSWTASSTSSVSSYLIFRNQSPLGQVGSSALSFEDHNQVLNQPVTYTIYAVDNTLGESIGVTINFP